MLMKKKYFVFWLFALTWSLLLPPDVLSTEVSSAKDAKNLILRVEQGYTVGSAIVLRRSGRQLLALTAAHVIATDEAITVRARPWPELTLEATPIERFRDTDLDIAVLSIELPEAVLATAPRNWRAVPVSAVAFLSEGSYSRFIGQTHNEPWMVSPRVELQRADKTSANFHYICEQGLSGGGVFDGSWRLLGLTIERNSTTVCGTIPVEALLRIFEHRWNLSTDWELQVGPPAEPAERRLFVTLAPITSMTSSLPADSNLEAIHLQPLLQGLEGVDSGTEARAGALKLAADIQAYSQDRISETAYGTSFTSDVFKARIRLRLQETGGAERWSKTYAVEVVDYGSADRLGSFAGAPISELFDELAQQARGDLRVALDP